MRVSLYCLAIALAFRFAFGQAVLTPTFYNGTGRRADPVAIGHRILIVKGFYAGDWRSWLIVEAHNGREFQENGFDPTYSRLLCDYKPIVRQLPNGQYEIEFVSPIAEKLP